MNKQNNEQDNIIYSSKGSFTGDVEYALPVEEKDRGFKKSGTKRRGSANDDLNDYIYMTPVKNSSSHKKEKKKKKLWLKILIGILIGLIVLILSGIIESRLEMVKTAYEAVGMEVVLEKRKGEWFALVLKHR